MSQKRQLSLFSSLRPSHQRVSDIDEVSYLRLYGNRKSSSATTPRVDIVTPQPKAFYAYMRMPLPEIIEVKHRRSAAERPIRRARIGGKGKLQ